MNFKNLKMNSKTLLKLLILFTLIFQKTVYGQELDTICLPVLDVKVLAASHEKLIFADSLIKIQDEEIKLLKEVVKEKQVQNTLHQSTLNGLRNEVVKLRKQRTILSVGLGGALAAILVLVF